MGSLFDLSHGVEPRVLTMCLVALVCFTICLELVLHELERRVEGLWRATFHKLYKELMVLGLLSFGLLLVVENSGDVLAHATLQAFELAHLELFTVALAFIGHAVVFAYVCRSAFRSWSAMQAEHPSMVGRARLLARNQGAVRRYICGRSRRQEHLHFHLVRSYFVHSHGLPGNFDFAAYLSGAVIGTITQLIDVSPLTWGLLGVLLVASLALPPMTTTLAVAAVHGNVTATATAGHTAAVSFPSPYFTVALGWGKWISSN